MGLELEFIDLSKDEENEISRVSNGPDERRMRGAGEQRRNRNRAPVMIQMEDRRSDQTERQRRQEAEEIQAIMPRRLGTERPRRPGTQAAGWPETGEVRRPEPGMVRRQRVQATGRPGAEVSGRPRRPEAQRPRRPGTVTPEVRRTGTSSQRASQPGRGNAARRPRPADPGVEKERAVRRRRRKRRRIAARMATMLFLVSLIAGSGFLLYKLFTDTTKEKEPQVVISTDIKREEVIEANKETRPDIREDFLTVNEYSRPGEPLEEVNNIFVHYTANPGTSAAQNRSYFENLGITGETSASAHFVIGYEGEIVQCIPLNEIAYAVMKRNYDSVSIECCYLTDDGKFTDATYQSLIRLSAWLLNEYHLAPEDMRRHYDEGGKKCPLYYVEHEEAWNQFLRDLENYIMKEQV